VWWKQRRTSYPPPYNTAEGPLWRVRLLTKATANTYRSQDPTFCHNYALLFGIHHALADGFTNIRICNMLHTILEDVMAGRTVDDEQQLGEHVDDTQVLGTFEQETRKLMEDPKLLAKAKEQLHEDVCPLLHKFFPAQENTDIKTSYVNTYFNEEMTRSFLHKCKAEGVSLHCGLTGVINVAIIELLESFCELPHEINFRAGHDVNIRRYYTGDTSRTLSSFANIWF
ncbi:LOW QUALITY PROTEIN: uncharacterized protein LOC121860035, partial [Homarus americanus]|uniref:LOW QUALITY PROTEIN: uncharacterized protein LOC121860035 n=1 Tax=Homarus americanus TaxID=6706 RepID=UPI001C46F784